MSHIISPSLTAPLVAWYRAEQRDLPWRNHPDPYAIWISEIILQQTRVEQGRGYFERFMATFPTVRCLAEASEDEVLAQWQGLGYYSRARNLHRAAKEIMARHGGTLPADYEQLRRLPGIGPYTAGAIASFAFGIKAPAVDGNVLRVVSRLIASEVEIDTPAGRNLCTECVEVLLQAPLPPGDINQSLIELGAIMCTPAQPQCSRCPIATYCQVAYLPKRFDLPRRSKGRPVQHRYMLYKMQFAKGRIALFRREGRDIWRGLYQFTLVSDQEQPLVPEEEPTLTCEHLLTHRRLHLSFVVEELPEEIALPQGGQWVPLSQLAQYALPVPLLKALRELSVRTLF